MINPDKYIRGALVEQLKPIRCWYVTVPISIKVPDGEVYAIIPSQSKQPTEISKDCYDWNCQINIDLWQVAIDDKGNPALGVPPNTALDDAVEQVLNKLENFTIPTWLVQDVTLENQVDLPVNSPDKSIYRKVLTFNMWLARNFREVDRTTVNSMPADADYDVEIGDF